jgi:solute carrier family 25 phosphate transporter 3
MDLAEMKNSSMLPEFLYNHRGSYSSPPPPPPVVGGMASYGGGALSSSSLHRRFMTTPALTAASSSSVGKAPEFIIPAASEGKIKMFSPEYYRACAIGGTLCCGLTHMAVTPIDVVKCNMQIAPEKYRSIAGGFSLVVKEQGPTGLFRGWAPTLLGYSIQGACKYGFYEYFKKTYSDMVGAENAKKYKTLIYLAGSASAEVIADVGLCPFEAVKVRVQTKPGFAKGLVDGFPKIIANEGVGGLYKGLVPLWARQIP